MDSFGLWRFSLWIYHQDAVAPACLQLQDRHGIDVNILLFMLWLGQHGQKVDLAVLKELSAEASDWHETVVLPLRCIRRALKNWGNPAQAEEISNFREKIKADEIGAEHLEQWILFQAAQKRLDVDVKVKDWPYLREEVCRTNALSYFQFLEISPSQNDDALIAKLARAASTFAPSEGTSVVSD